MEDGRSPGGGAGNIPEPWDPMLIPSDGALCWGKSKKHPHVKDPAKT